MTHPPRLTTDCMTEIRHEVVIDDSDVLTFPPDELASYFPTLRPGMRRCEIIEDHDILGQQHHYIIIDREAPPLNLGDKPDGNRHAPAHA